MMKLQNKKSIYLVAGMILVAAFSRLIPHYPNFTAVGATALFGAAYINRKALSLLIPIIAVWLSDLVLNNVLYASYYDGFTLFTSGSIWIFLGMAAIVVLGWGIFRKVTIGRFLGGAIGATVIFYLVTNFGHWAGPFSMHPKNGAGLLATYIDAIPFALNTLAGNVVFGAALFGAYYWLTQKKSIRGTLSGADKY